VGGGFFVTITQKERKLMTVDEMKELLALPSLDQAEREIPELANDVADADDIDIVVTPEGNVEVKA
jgi:hypothetical protein